MNQHLQSILNIIQQDESLTTEQKNAIAKSLKDADKELEITAFKLDRTEKVKKTTAILLEETIEELEQKRKAIEEQNRELEIESSLERVRTVAMAMRKPDDMLDVCRTISDQLQQLGFKEIRNVQTAIIYEERHEYLNYQYFTLYDKNSIERIDYRLHPEVLKFTEIMLQSADAYYTKTFEGDELSVWRDYRKQTNQLPDPKLDEVASSHYYFYSIGSGALGVTTYAPVSEEQIILFKRFRNVFQLAYSKFTDIEKAEAQAREARIEAALEKVRSRTMAMQRSEELAEVATVLFQQVKALGISQWVCGFSIWEIGDKEFTWYPGSPDGEILPPCKIPLTEHPVFISIDESRRRGDELFVYEKEGEFQADHYRYMMLLPGMRELLQNMLDAGQSFPTFQIDHLANFSHGNLVFITYEHFPEMHDIFKRFAKVFDQTYTRFLDLQKAEEQARESQIQLGLERVRARAMAMQTSEELNELIGTVFTELTKLDLVLTRCVIMIYEGLNKGVRWWMANSEIPNEPMNFYVQNNDDLPFFNDYFNEWQKRTLKWCYVLDGENKIKVDEFIFSDTELSQLPDFVKEGMRAPEKIYLNVSFNSFGCITLASLEPLPDEHFDIMLRFAKVFDITYTRFNDLQKAEAQAREAQIEAALERVRSRTMAMQRSDELQDTALLLFSQVQALGVPSFACGFNIWDDDKKAATAWMAGEDRLQPPFKTSSSEDVFLHIREAAQRNEQLFVVEQKGEELENHYRYMATIPEFKFVMDKMAEAGLSVPTFQIIHCAFFSQGYIMFISFEQVPEAHDIFIRFAKVFEQTYTRFLDLVKAEEQAREAQIEAGLERVRARAMAMQKSDELKELIGTVSTELSKLDIILDRSFIITYDTQTMGSTWWMANPETPGKSIGLFVKYHEYPPYLAHINAWEARKIKWQYILEGEVKKAWDKFLFVETELSQLPDFVIANMRSKEKVYLSSSFNNFGYLTLATLEPLSNEQFDIMLRFAKVFDLTYTRFNDLQKAEAQAREAQIEAALERVRAKAMAMHSSEDLAETIKIFYHQLELLNLMPRRCGVGLINKETHSADLNGMIVSEQGEAKEIEGQLKFVGHPVLKSVYDNWLLQKEYHPVLRGNEIKDYYQFIGSQISVQNYPDDAVQYGYFFFFTEGCVYAWTEQEFSEDALKIYRRFTSVLSLTYKRYKDLKLAEAQAREATIEAALEKVRGKAMAMHNSNDLSVTASMIFTELRKLGINPIRCGVGLLNKESRKAQLYSATSSVDGDSLALVGWVELSGHPVLEHIYDTWVRNEDYFPELSGEQLKSYYDLLLKGLSVKVPDWKRGEKQYGTFLSFAVGCLYAWSENSYSDAEIKILKRFATIIDLTFRRYMDLQKSEASAKEAIKQAALDRIRADIASMRTINDLERITPLVWNELTILGVPFIRCGVFIMDETQQLIHTFLSTPDGKAIGAFHLPYTTAGNILQVLKHWKDKKIYIDRWDESAFTEFADILVKQGALASPDEYLKTIPEGGFYLHFLPFLQGMLYVGNTTELSDDEIRLIQSVADAFSTAYARYEDFNKLEAAKKQIEKTVVDLRQTQAQLIQAEKMASLGELTAGIAHEIQNPLNFVNNFSEVNVELIDEMKEELKKGHTAEAILIAKDIKDNQEKINQHGKRADAIVKGMLQHSRSSTNSKEPTDINALADEYLRLSYHGLRAKDKSFNAKMETYFDESIGNISIVPQDIGRVILNLITNAFYAVTEKKKQVGDRYEPVVSISTKKNNGKVEISVTDNGNGIPQKVLDKIFQPFFTTKPTGQGTGLGLSLSYDIVKAHGGEIKVKTKERVGTEFIVELNS